MAQSISDLNTINLRKLATPNKKYYGDNEKVYIGTSEGRLRLLEKARESIFNPTDNINQNNVQDAFEIGLSNIDNTSDANKPVSILQKEYIDLGNKINNDDSIAYSIALGG